MSFINDFEVIDLNDGCDRLMAFDDVDLSSRCDALVKVAIYSSIFNRRDSA